MNYLNSYYQDYKAVAVETKNDIKSHPIKASFCLLGFGILGFFHKTVPDEASFLDKFLESTTELAIVGEKIRNPETVAFMRSIVQHQNKERLHYTNFGLFSIVWFSDHGNGVDLFEAHCQHLQPKWRQYRDRIVDVGVLGQWVWIQQYMHDYDINPDEWGETTGS